MGLIYSGLSLTDLISSLFFHFIQRKICKSHSVGGVKGDSF